MAIAGIVKVLFQGNTKGLSDASLQALKTLGDVQKQVVAASKTMQKDFNGQIFGTQKKDTESMLAKLSHLSIISTVVGKGLRSAFSGSKDLIGQAVSAASDLNEQTSATGSVFKESASMVVAEADLMAKKFGIVKSEFLAGANSLGGIFKASGFNDSEAAKLSAQYVKLATDVSSFKNISVEEALQKLRSGLVGEAEPLRAMGVLLSEAAVKQSAYGNGIAKVGEELTEQQKVKARMLLIDKSLADANGDLERTQDGVANKSREVRGRFINLAADIGQAIEPISQSILGGLGNAITGIASSFGDVKTSVNEWSQTSVQKGGIVYESMRMLGRIIGGIVEAMLTLVSITLKAGAGLADLASKIPGLGDSARAARDQLNSLAAGADVMKGAGYQITSFFDTVADGASKAALPVQQLKTATQEVGAGVLELADKASKMEESMKEDILYHGISKARAELLKLRKDGLGNEEARRMLGLIEKQEALDELDKQKNGAKKTYASINRAGSQEFYKTALTATLPSQSNNDTRQVAKNTADMVKEMKEVKTILASKGADNLSLNKEYLEL
jgi:hypothetical protein